MGTIANCARCSKPFARSISRRRFCSDKCKRHKCPSCGRKFVNLRASRERRGRFCSRACSAARPRPRPPKTKCPICKIMMLKRRNGVTRTTCSKKCAGKLRSNEVLAKRPPGTWWCSDCRKHLSLSEFGPALSRSQCRKHSSAYDVKRERELKKAVVEAFGGGCSRCPYNRCMAALDFHHPDPSKKEITWSRVRKRTLENALKMLRAEGVVLVCANCHRELHWGLDECLVMPSSKEERLNTNVARHRGTRRSRSSRALHR